MTRKEKDIRAGSSWQRLIQAQQGRSRQGASDVLAGERPGYGGAASGAAAATRRCSTSRSISLLLPGGLRPVFW
jgi:hypothetical protein